MPIRKGMILSAGLGTRLSPITNTIPKPLVPVLNLPNIVHAIDLLKRSNIKDIIVNLHHLADDIQSYLGDGNQFGVSLRYTLEKTLLGTGGGVKKAESFFEEESFVLVNCDFVSDFDLTSAISRHEDRQAVATMILTKTEKKYTPVYFDDQNKLTGIGKGIGTAATFTGIHILSPKSLNYLRPTFSGINNDLYPHLIEREEAYGEFIDGFWLDTGDVATIFDSSISLLSQISTSKSLQNTLGYYLDYFEAAPGVWIPGGKKLSGIFTTQSPCLIAAPEAIARGSSVGPYAVMGTETVIEKKATISNCITIGMNQISGDIRDCLLYQNRNLLEEESRSV